MFQYSLVRRQSTDTVVYVSVLYFNVGNGMHCLWWLLYLVEVRKSDIKLMVILRNICCNIVGLLSKSYTCYSL